MAFDQANKSRAHLVLLLSIYAHAYTFTHCQDDSGSISRDELTQALETIEVMAMDSAQASFCFQPTDRLAS